MNKKIITDIHLKNKKVIVRLDLNVPIENGIITSNKRIVASLTTIKYLIDNDAKIIILSHFSRIKKQDDLKTKSLKPIALELERLLNHKVLFIPYTRGVRVEDAINNMKPKQVIMLENTRFEDLDDKKESKNNSELAKYWASLADVFINDAFGTTHREHASNVGISKFIKESALGFLIKNELDRISLLQAPARPFYAILGGAKISDKLNVIKKILSKADKVFIVGAMAYTFLKASNYSVGDSLVEDNFLDEAKALLKNNSDKIFLPIDFAYASSYADLPRQETNDRNIPDGFEGLDIGSKTIHQLSNSLKDAKTILWNGPAGVSEFSNYSKGTFTIAKTIANLKDVYSIVGGGDSISAIEKLNLENKFFYISTGGGSLLQYLEGKPLPGIEWIQEKE
ncbi:MAG: phosphoglycerate kinase [Mycoplasma sp.]|nr:phosphoglycerate kinase [Mycoplasma sp.]